LAVAYLLNWTKEHAYAESNKELRGRQIDAVFLGDSITALWTSPEPRHHFAVHPGLRRIEE
jgi:hypothetical protein